VVGSNQIAYLRPVFLMEDIVIQSQLLQFGDSHLLVELRMLNSDKTKLKAIMWGTFVHFYLLHQKKKKGFRRIYGTLQKGCKSVH
jgi:acyl-CoA thioester hydrolase